MQSPNILYIHSHDTGRYVQPYGHAIPTPNLQRLAEEGVLFRRAFSGAPTCSPSRAALLTGQCAHAAGMLGLAHRGFRLHDYRRHLLHVLRERGYTSALSGVQHISHAPYHLVPGEGGEPLPPGEAIGYDRDLNPYGAGGWAKDGGIAERAVDFLGEGHEDPWFLSVGFFETHRRYPEPEPSDEPARSLPPPPVPDTPRTRRDMAAYKRSAARLDAGIGRVLQALADSGQADNTLVICTTDHGIAFPHMKCTLTDHGIGVMLILRGPEPFTGGRTCDALVSHLDVFPTLCELLDVAPPSWLEGASLLPLLTGAADAVREEVFAEVTYHAAYEPMRCVRTERYKYIKRFFDYPYPVMPNIDAGPSKNELLQAGLRNTRPAREEFYDLLLDPQERCSRLEDPDYADAIADCRRRLARWMEETDDPLLAGPVPAPEGAIVNEQHHLHPTHDGKE